MLTFKHYLTEKKDKGWIGIDLDGCLAYYDHFRGDKHIGKPIPEMVKKFKNLVKNGKKVKIFTARASSPKKIEIVKKWLKDNDLPNDVEITNIKDHNMIELWDDRTKRVKKNKGIFEGVEPNQFIFDFINLMKPEDEKYPGQGKYWRKNDKNLTKLPVAVREEIYSFINYWSRPGSGRGKLFIVTRISEYFHPGEDAQIGIFTPKGNAFVETGGEFGGMSRNDLPPGGRFPIPDNSFVIERGWGVNGIPKIEITFNFKPIEGNVISGNEQKQLGAHIESVDSDINNKDLYIHPEKYIDKSVLPYILNLWRNNIQTWESGGDEDITNDILEDGEYSSPSDYMNQIENSGYLNREYLSQNKKQIREKAFVIINKKDLDKAKELLPKNIEIELGTGGFMPSEYNSNCPPSNELIYIQWNIHKTYIENKKSYSYIGTCKNSFNQDANYMMQIVQQDDLKYPEKTWFHNPKLRISKEYFIKLVGNYRFFNKPNIFYGYNPDENIVFAYDPKKDTHYFFGKS